MTPPTRGRWGLRHSWPLAIHRRRNTEGRGSQRARWLDRNFALWRTIRSRRNLQTSSIESQRGIRYSGVTTSVAERLSYVGESLRDSRVRGHQEWLANDCFLDAISSDALRADFAATSPIGRLNPNLLQVRVEAAFGDTGRLATVSAEILRLAALDQRITPARCLTANVTDTGHD